MSETTTHRKPCTDGDHCGEPAHCPPLDENARWQARAERVIDRQGDTLSRMERAMSSLADHFDGVFVSHGNGVTEDVGGSIRATLTAAMTKGPTMETEAAHAALCDTTATIESVLAAHQPIARQDEGGYAIRQGCTCGWNSPREVGAHRRHVAEQLIESVAPVEFARAQRVAALARLLVAEGRLTPQGKRLIDRALTEEES